MPLRAGDKLGPYEIVAPLGAGGMGEVYRARDSKLNRDVALKVLSAALAQDADYMARFQREAQVLASLNHPHIAQIYGLEENAIVMELVEGEEPRGPLPVEEALKIARQVAQALEAAHEKGIVHRDLKPANIRIKPDGTVKVLDFGLAKVSDSRPAASGNDSPTLTMRATQLGVILGTAAYMAPEQAAGKPVDRRADIWSFGVVLWELLTGKRLFDGETISHTLADVLRAPIDLKALPPETPPSIRALIRQSLERDLGKRLQWIGDGRIAIEEALANPRATPEAAPRGSSKPWIAIACAATAVATVAAAGWFRATRPAELPLVRFEVELGTDLAPEKRAAISPDGSRIAFVAIDSGGKRYLLTRRLDQPKASVLDQGHVRSPFFSPDSKWIGYEAEDKLKKIPVEGGLAITITGGVVTGSTANWAESGEIVSALTYAGLARVPSAGGAPQPIPGAENHDYGAFLPGGTALLLSGEQHNRPLSVLPLRGGKAIPISQAQGRYAQYLPIGYILYLDERAVLQALPFDARRMAAKGPPIPMLEEVSFFDISSAGALLCRHGKAPNSLLTVQWVDESGKMEPIIPTPAAYSYLQLSPSGKRLALTISDEKGSSLWIHDLQTHAMNRLTLGDSASDPVWMPTGKHLLFRGGDGIYVVPADGGGKPRRILDTDGVSSSVSPDGRTLAMMRRGKDTERDIWLASLEGEGDNLQAGKPEPFVNSPADETINAFSPNGKWLAYASTQSGTFQVYVRSLKNSGAIWQLPAPNLFGPQWSPGGGEIFLRTGGAFGGSGDWKVLVASYSVNGDTFVPGAIRPFGGDLRIPANGAAPVFAVAPQGRRIAAVLEAKEPEDAHSNYILLLNFFDEIKRRAAQTTAQ